MRDSNRAAFDDAIRTGEATDPSLIAASVVVTIAAIYVLLFLPDASIFVPFETQQRTAVRVLFNSVNYVRWSLVALVCWQVAIVYSVLHTAMNLAATLDHNVKLLHMLDDRVRSGNFLPLTFGHFLILLSLSLALSPNFR